MQEKFKMSTEIYESYLHDEDVTIVWQILLINGECVQRSLIGWYCGEPDPRTTETYSNMPLVAQFTELYS